MAQRLISSKRLLDSPENMSFEAPSSHLTIEHMGGYANMADDRMKNDDLQRNMGGAKGNEGQNPGQQSPGRTGQGQEGGGKQAGGYGGGQQQDNKGTNERDLEDDDLGAGNAQTGGQGRGGQNR
jgi:hypothetical protein